MKAGVRGKRRRLAEAEQAHSSLVDCRDPEAAIAATAAAADCFFTRTLAAAACAPGSAPPPARTNAVFGCARAGASTSSLRARFVAGAADGSKIAFVERLRLDAIGATTALGMAKPRAKVCR